MPSRFLLLLTLLNLFNYIDRYIFSSLMPAMKADLLLSDTQLGWIGSAFILSYVLFSPIFGWWGDHHSRPRLMAMGAGIWSVMTATSGMASSFAMQVLTRAGVGLGESAYTVLASPVIADLTPPDRRGRTFAVYIGAIPVGAALGYILGGLLEARVGWRLSLAFVGGPGLLLAFWLGLQKDPPRGAHDPVTATPPLNTRQGARALLSNGAYLWATLGYAAYTFVVGGLAFWMPSYIVRYFAVSLQKGNLVFGAVTVAGGLVGTVIGGPLADYWEKRGGQGFMKVPLLAMLLSIPFFGFVLMQKDFYVFAGLLFFLQVLLFACLSPLEAFIVSSVQPALRASAMAWNILTIHILGDGISRVLMGSVADHAGLRAALDLSPWILIIAAGCWGLSLVLYWRPAPWPESALKLPDYQRHRGDWKEGGFTENSLEAFRSARRQGLSMVELDTQLSKDGVAIVTHDVTLARLYQIDADVASFSAAELWESAKIPTLVDVLKDPDSPSLVNIELKSGAVTSTGLERAVVRAVKEARAEGRVLFSSFNPICLWRLKSMLPDIPRALLVSDERDDPKNKIYLRKMWLAFLAYPHLLHLEQSMITPVLLPKLKARGIPVAAWTVNDPVRARALQDAGIVSIISDQLGSRSRN